jgi:hypothetical protein
MIDVLDAYGSADEEVVPRMVSELLEKEETEGPDKLGYYRNAEAIRPRDQWQTGLVLCTLCAHEGIPEVSEVIVRTVEWLLGEQETEQRWRAEDERSDPMYTARVLKGLVAALPFASQELKPRLCHAIENGNAWLAATQGANGMFVNEKSTIVVLEYLSTLPEAEVPRPTYVPPPRTSLRDSWRELSPWTRISLILGAFGAIIGILSL